MSDTVKAKVLDIDAVPVPKAPTMWAVRWYQIDTECFIVGEAQCTLAQAKSYADDVACDGNNDPRTIRIIEIPGEAP